VASFLDATMQPAAVRCASCEERTSDPYRKAEGVAMFRLARKRRLSQSIDAKVRHFGVAAIGITGCVLVVAIILLSQCSGVH